ncbi:hypothetical protein N5915_06825 [Arcobacter lacus]|uniref:Uncharacterized protein n=1 Tax=Arcobacter lacus TaxID=1912876 RepID=A0ABX5JFH5_9BACT|nr:hypothetical protein [Arcobacter lacus]MCT7909271.1 hypothetical protein [Arcobacter lacus]PUE65231.1 hypothetical protein B0175_07765 [Arcobacter lacus]
MKKIIFVTALSVSALLAFDIGGALKNAGTAALNGDTDAKSLTKTATESAGLTSDALGEKLATAVKSNNTAVSSMDKAKELCTQASTVQSIANISSDIVTKAITVCTEKVLETK